MDTDSTANREYKDSVFTLLFGEKDNLIELYNAIFNTRYGSDTDIQITTLRSVLFMEQINDISFVIDGKIVVLIEHQSTLCKNMPLRMLLYIARIYEKISDNENLYRTKLITIPRPEFIVLYNGIEDAPDEQTLKLSDMFAKYGEENTIELELAVKVYNINQGRNPDMAQRSSTLSGYEFFVQRVREYQKETKDLRGAISLAIKDCINRNILKTFLETHGSEVMNMLLTEWKLEDALRVREQEGREEGFEKGRKENAIRVAQNLKNMGMGVEDIVKATGLTVDEVLKHSK